MAVFALGVVVAPVLGPTLGGWLTDTYSWRWAFYINIPIGIFAIFMISRYVEDPPYIKNAKSGQDLTASGWACWRSGSGCLQIILDKGQEDDWFGATWIRWARDDSVWLSSSRFSFASCVTRNRWWTCASSATATSPSAAC